MITRAKWVAGLATLLLAGASSGVALGHGSYSVSFSGVPTSAVKGQHLTYSVTAKTPILKPPMEATLAVYTSGTTACAATAEGEAKLRHEGKARSAFLTKYYGEFKGSEHLPLSSEGTHHICAYVYDVPAHTLADRHALFVVTPPLPKSPHH